MKKFLLNGTILSIAFLFSISVQGVIVLRDPQEYFWQNATIGDVHKKIQAGENLDDSLGWALRQNTDISVLKELLKIDTIKIDSAILLDAVYHKTPKEILLSMIQKNPSAVNGEVLRISLEKHFDKDIILEILKHLKSSDMQNTYHRDELGYNMSLLSYAIQEGADADIVKAFQNSGVDIHMEDEQAFLTAVSKSNDSNLINHFLQSGCDVNYQRNRPYQTGLRPIETLDYINSEKPTTSSPLTIAVASNKNLEIIKALLQAGANVNERTKEGLTPLMIAAQFSTPEIVSFLIESGADVNEKGKDTGNTLLMYAARNDAYPEMIQKFIQLKLNVNQLNKKGLPVLAYTTNEEIVKKLIQAGAKDVFLSPGYWKIATPADVEKRIQQGQDVNNSKTGYQPLYLAILENAKPPVLETLIKHGAKVNAFSRKGWHNETPLILAVKQQNNEAIKVLLKAGANVNLRGGDHESALDVMRYSNYTEDKEKAIETIKLLSNADAIGLFDNPLYWEIATIEDIKKKIKKGENVNTSNGIALLSAIEKQDKVLVDFLIKSGADVNQGYRMPLMLALKNENMDIVKSLIQAGADVNYINPEDTWDATPLLMAISQRKKANVVKMLIDAGADVNARNENGDTPLHILTSYIDYDYVDEASKIVKMLIDAGADVNAKNDEGRLPTSDRKEIIELLGQKGADSVLTKWEFWSKLTPEILDEKIKNGLDPNIRLEDGNRAKGSTLLMYVRSSKQSAALAKKLIDAGADVNAADEEGNTPLMAIYPYEETEDSIERIKILLDAGADVNAKNKHGYTALTQIGSNFHTVDEVPQTIRLLVEAGATGEYLLGSFWQKATVQDILAQEKKGLDLTKDLTPFEIACRRTENTDVFNFLIGKLDKNSANYKNILSNCLGLAIEYNPNQKIPELLLKAGASLNSKLYGRSILANSVEKDNFDLVKLLVEAGIDVNQRNDNGETALMYAETPEIADFLIKSGATIGAFNSIGYWKIATAADVQKRITAGEKPFSYNSERNPYTDALLLAARYAKEAEIIELLVKQGADVNAIQFGSPEPTVLMLLNENDTTIDKEKAFEILLKSGADIYKGGGCGITILDKMCSGLVSQNIVKLFIKYGLDVNYKLTSHWDEGDEPTLLMCLSKNPENAPLISDLITKGANVNATDNKGKTALMYAERYNKENRTIQDILIKAGTNINTKDKEGKTSEDYKKEKFRPLDSDFGCHIMY